MRAMKPTDREKNVELVKILLDAAKKDHEESRITSGKFKIREYERKIFESYPDLDNKTLFQTAYRTHRIKSGDAKGNASTLSGDDVYRTARFFLVNLAGYGWHNFRQVLNKAGEPYAELLEEFKNEGPIGNGVDYEKIASQKVGDLIKPGEDFGTVLREMADQFDLIQSKNRMTNSENKQLIEGRAKIRKQVGQVAIALSRITAAYENATPEKAKSLKQELERCQHLLLTLQKSV